MSIFAKQKLELVNNPKLEFYKLIKISIVNLTSIARRSREMRWIKSL